jgi:hypothetical protein
LNPTSSSYHTRLAETLYTLGLYSLILDSLSHHHHHRRCPQSHQGAKALCNFPQHDFREMQHPSPVWTLYDLQSIIGTEEVPNILCHLLLLTVCLPLSWSFCLSVDFQQMKRRFRKSSFCGCKRSLLKGSPLRMRN